MIVGKIILKIDRVWKKYLLSEKNLNARKQYTFTGNNEYPRFGTDGQILNPGDKSKIKLGESVFIDGIVQSMSGKGIIEIDDNSYVGPNSRIWSYVKIIVGKNVLISHNCNIFDSNCHPVNFMDRRKDYASLIRRGEGNVDGSVSCISTVIEDDVWMGANSSIMKGVTIGARSIIATGSVVTESVPVDVIVAGNPARIIKSLKEINDAERKEYFN